jgi:thiamine-phosphate pyrophosphorylase
MRLPGPLLLITNRTIVRYPLLALVELALAAGCRWVLVREKDLSAEDLARLVQKIMAVARTYGAAISVSGNPAVAAAYGACGVHLPQGASIIAARHIVGAGALLGVSAHSLIEAQAAADLGADYVTLSPIFLTESKPGYGPTLGLDELRRVTTTLPIPVVALGGITAINAADCLRAGAAGIAVMGAVMRAEEPGQAVKELLEMLDQRTVHKENI